MSLEEEIRELLTAAAKRSEIAMEFETDSLDWGVDRTLEERLELHFRFMEGLRDAVLRLARELDTRV